MSQAAIAAKSTTSAALAAAEAAADPKAHRLAAFRTAEDAAGDRRPQQFSESTDPAAPAPIESRPVGEPQPADPAAAEPETPPIFADNARKAIAARSRANRAAQPTPPRPDVDLLPSGVAYDDDPTALDAADEPREPAPRQPQPQPRAEERQPQPAPRGDGYSLRVFQNTFTVSRDELLRYADVTPEDAAEMTDRALVTLAQKQLAADALLDQAKQERKASRTAARDDEADPPRGEQRQADHGSPQPGQGLHGKTNRELMELVQIGDPDEALEAQNLLNRRQFAAQEQGRALAEVDRSITTAIETFANDPQNADITGDDIRAAAHRGQLSIEIANDLRPLLTDDQYRRIAVDPNLAREAYKAARADGARLRDPSQIFADAAAKVRTSFGARPADPDPRTQRLEQDEPSRRDDVKRQLFRQPTRSDSVIQQPQAGQRPQRRDPSSVIRERFGNRMNRG